MDYWKHSMLVATSARDIARRLGMGEISGDAFLAGMLHDLGFQLLIKYFPNEYSKILLLVENGEHNFLAAEKVIMGVTHQEIGKFLHGVFTLHGGQNFIAAGLQGNMQIAA